MHIIAPRTPDAAKEKAAAPSTTSTLNVEALVSSVFYVATVAFVATSALGLGPVPARYELLAAAGGDGDGGSVTGGNATWAGAATPRAEFGYVAAATAALGVGWLGVHFAGSRAYALGRTHPWMWLMCLGLVAWNASALLDGTVGAAVDVACMAAALGGALGIGLSQRSWRAPQRASTAALVADAFASAAAVLITFWLAVLGMALALRVPEVVEVLGDNADAQNALPNAVTAVVVLVLVMQTRDPAAPVVAAACAATQATPLFVVFAVVLHGVLSGYTLLRRTKLCAAA